MTKIEILVYFLIFLIFSSCNSEDPIIPARTFEHVILKSQNDVDNFQYNENDSILNLTIDSFLRDPSTESPVENLNNLSRIKYVSNNLVIVGNRLESLEGFENLEVVGGNFYIGENSNLKTLKGLDNLTKLEGQLTVHLNRSLESLSSLNRIKNIGGINISSNVITRLNGFSKIENITYDFFIYDEELTSISELKNLKTIGGYFRLTETSIENLSGLDNLEVINDWFLLSDNDYLTNLQGAGSLKKVGDFVISSNLKINNLSGFNSLEEVNGDFWLTGNDNLITTGQFPKLKKVNGNFNIFNTIDNFDGMESLGFIGGDVEITHFPVTTIKGLKGLKRVEGSINLNGTFSSLDGLQNLIYIGGDFKMELLPNLKSLSKLENLETIGGTLFVQNCDELLDFKGMHNLKSIGGLSLSKNELISSLDGFQNITNLNNSLFIIGTKNFKTLDGIENVASIGDRLYLDTDYWSTPSYNICAIKDLIQNNAIGGFVWAFNPSITNNINNYITNNCN